MNKSQLKYLFAALKIILITLLVVFGITLGLRLGVEKLKQMIGEQYLTIILVLFAGIWLWYYLYRNKKGTLTFNHLLKASGFKTEVDISLKKHMSFSGKYDIRILPNDHDLYCIDLRNDGSMELRFSSVISKSFMVDSKDSIVQGLKANGLNEGATNIDILSAYFKVKDIKHNIDLIDFVFGIFNISGFSKISNNCGEVVVWYRMNEGFMNSKDSNEFVEYLKDYIDLIESNKSLFKFT